MPFERYFANAALRSARGKAANVKSPLPATEPSLLAGARNYRKSCAFCHGLPDIPKTDVQEGMYPPPPPLLSGKGVTDDPVGETHWVVQNGIRMTGMPAFDRVFSDDELWQISQLLLHANALPSTVQQLLKEPDSVPVEPGSGSSSTASSEARQ
jgi:thiosulfate dehydrogenase